ncbi:8-oxo-dGTP diphosphatase [Mammaliicoccus lentus]|uniref:8-oxo-dGTP diphosphatase n=1 Tax=Mammaliicoccus lentus TaxID=42858 RepID=UPI0024A7DAA4|nr:8-oxo-dGTP diphosphatase [Mammaliicoccus lentus]WHI54852.1 8-oxo-dGTP diphosphatase [Mammaliicoccus lentus]WHI57374.1 8-oxo-dGTP diphosphatase [Mammaliicoccus lentus]WHI65221.1 8-oxo-dGTP diphosphatase [Mammaliicoccus lentus]WHI86114.1 8-oxo-dGTP diphosphatase [Mammaliicoccus lentus]WHI90623.1 8-oxo-dGTP diphosphatase [Mammaliicoccus lentus]
MEKVIFYNMCMIYDAEKVVVIDRKKDDWPGISFPGGKVEHGESFINSTIREIKEGTGLDISNLELCGVKNWMDDEIRYVIFLYRTNNYSGVLVSSDEGEVRWEQFSNLTNLKLSLDMEKMLRIFQENNLSEFFYFKGNGKWNFHLN